jgi:hypothetical protein
MPSPESNNDYQAIQSDPLNLQGIIDDLDVEASAIQDLRSELGNKRIGQYGAGQVTITPAGVLNTQGGTGDLGKLKEVELLGKNGSALYAVDELRLQSGGQGDPTLKIEGGDVVIYVAGDVRFAGGTSLEIADDSSLTLIVEGKTTITGGFDFMNDEVLNENGDAIFTLLSNYSHNSPNATAVKLSGGGHILGAVYAAHSNIDITGGSYIRGQALGPNINISGGTGVYYESVSSGGSGSAEESYVPGSELDIDYEYY